MLKKKNSFLVGLFVLACLGLNLLGKAIFATNYPIWGDSYGTALAAYTAGPVVGALVGATTNIIFAFWNPSSCPYALVSISIGIIIGVCARKGYLNTIFGTMNTSALVTLSAAILSTVINELGFKGSTSNVWGNAVSTYFQILGVSRIVGYTLGEFYIDFLDKLIMMALLAATIKIARKIRTKKKRRHWFQPLAAEFSGNDGAKKTISMILIFAMLLPLLSVSHITKAAQASSFAWGGLFDKTTEEATSTDATATDASLGDASGIQLATEKYNSYVQTIYNRETGLSCGEANDIVATKDGVLWIGTYAGLYRYAGSKFILMNQYDSIKNVNALYVDEEGRLWVGTNDSGVSILINEELVNVLGDSEGLPTNSVKSICEDYSGNYYVGTSGALAILSIYNGLTVTKTNEEVQYVRSMSAREDGVVAAVTDDGVLFLLKNGDVLQKIELDIADEVFSTCSFADDGKLYAGSTGSTIVTYNVSEDLEASELATEDSRMVAEGLVNIKTIQETEGHNIFITADRGVGIRNYEGDFGLINTNSFNSSIDRMLVDYQGNVWFTSSRLGLLKLSKSAFYEIFRKAGLSESVVNSETVWNNKMYFGTDDGLFATNLANNQILTDSATETLEGVRIRCLMVDSKGNLWASTSGKGFYCFTSPDEFTVYDDTNGSTSNKTRNTLELSDGTILAGTDNGILFIKDGKIISTLNDKDDLTNSKILSAMELPDGKVYACTDGGGIAVISNRKVERMLTVTDGLSSNVILRTIYNQEGKGVFIVASNGLQYMNEKGEINTLSNFPYYNNYDIVLRGEKAFVLSGAGIYVTDREKLIANREVNYSLLDSKRGMRESMTSNSFNYLDEDGNLYIACNVGCYMMNLDTYDELAHSYRMMVSKIDVDGNTLNLNSDHAMELDRGVEKIVLHPEVVNYSVNDPNVSYFLEGYDRQEKVVLQSELGAIEYDNLPVGDYTFHFSVLNDDGTEKIEEVKYEIRKNAELYDYWWFRTYIIAIAALALIWLTWFIARVGFQRQIEHQRQQLELARKEVKMGNETIIAIAHTVDAKDANTSQHSMRVAEYSVKIAERIGFDADQVDTIRKTALLHDIGKIKIPDSILNKPGKLTDEEYQIMKNHTVYGGEILKDFTLVDHVTDGALYHHERWDGKGYPHGLSGKDIPLNARIIAVSDAFDAMTARRVYREQMPFADVLMQLHKGRGTQFDPELLDILLELIKDGSIDINELYDDAVADEERASFAHTSILKALKNEEEMAGGAKK